MNVVRVGLSCVTLIAVVCVVGTETAVAHGGAYRGPNGMVPPGVREPTDPSPPPPVRGVAPGPPIPPSVPVEGSDAQPVRVRPMGFENWQFWYHANVEWIEARTQASLRRAQDAAPAVETLARLVASAPENRYVNGAACIALGKAAREGPHVDLLRRIAMDVERPTLVRESAVIGLGLLRRSATARQLAPEWLDRARDDLRRILQGDPGPAHLRPFAAVALGLLRAQPTRTEDLAKSSDARLFQLLDTKPVRPDLRTALLLSVGLQGPAPTAPHLHTLRTILSEGLVGSPPHRDLQRAHAATVLGRVGGVEDARRLLRILPTSSATYANPQRSAAAALAAMAERMPPAVRIEILHELIRLLRDTQVRDGEGADPAIVDETQRGLMLIAIARLAALELPEARGLSDGLIEASVYLRDRLTSGSAQEVTYAGLGLGWIGRALRGAEDRDRRAWRTLTVLLLRSAMASRRHAPNTRGAIALALGLIGDEAARSVLLREVNDPTQDRGLRGAAARALGLLGGGGEPTRSALERLLQQSDRDTLCQDAAAALGMLGSARSLEPIVLALARIRWIRAKGTAVRALANLGTREGIDTLCSMAEDAELDPATRSIAIAGLGLIADPEQRPSLALLTAHTNWRASAYVLEALYSLL